MSRLSALGAAGVLFALLLVAVDRDTDHAEAPAVAAPDGVVASPVTEMTGGGETAAADVPMTPVVAPAHSDVPRIPDDQAYVLERRLRDPNLVHIHFFEDLNWVDDAELRRRAENEDPAAMHYLAGRLWHRGEQGEAIRLYNAAVERGSLDSLGRAAFAMTRGAVDVPEKEVRDAMLVDAAVYFLTAEVFGHGAMVSNTADIFDRFPDIANPGDVCAAAAEKANSIQPRRRELGLPPYAEVDRERLWRRMRAYGHCGTPADRVT